MILQGRNFSITDRETGNEREVEVFVSILGASQLTYVEAVESQKKEDWLKVNDNALWYFQGVPAALVPDYVPRNIIRIMCPFMLCGPPADCAAMLGRGS